MFTIQDVGPKERSSDRVLILKPIGGKTVSSTGMVDPRLFKGENKLHLIMEPQSSIWYFKYEQGGLPELLKQRFTSFRMAKEYAEDYYKKRNVEITEVIE